jgi:hypothetical protein
MAKNITVRKMKTNIPGSVIAFAAALALSGCLKSPSDPAPLTPKTFLSILYLAPTATEVDIYFDDKKVSNNPFPPGTVTTIYNELEKGTFAVRFKKSGADSLVAQVPLALYDSMKYYTIFVYNQQANGPANAFRITDDFSNLRADMTKPYYRFFHSSPNVGPVDLYIDNIKVESGRTNGDNTQLDILNKFLGTTADIHTVQVKLAGTDTVIATGHNFEFVAGNAYTLYLKGLEGGTGSNQLSVNILRAAD